MQAPPQRDEKVNMEQKQQKKKYEYKTAKRKDPSGKWVPVYGRTARELTAMADRLSGTFLA